MKKISSKSIFASLIFLITMSFIINNFLNNNDLFEDNVKNKNSSKKQEKIVGVQIRQQNEDGVRFLIVQWAKISKFSSPIKSNSDLVFKNSKHFFPISSLFSRLSN